LCLVSVVLFFFSSRRRHTRFSRDWSSDVCSSDLVTHHFVGSHSITEPYNAAAYGEEALKLIENLSAKYEYLILCGGSGLYIQAVCDGFNEIPDIDPEIRMSLNRRYAEGGLPWLQQQMRDLDPE